jgi:hypothetical protein
MESTVTISVRQRPVRAFLVVVVFVPVMNSDLKADRPSGAIAKLHPTESLIEQWLPAEKTFLPFEQMPEKLAALIDFSPDSLRHCHWLLHQVGDCFAHARNRHTITAS